MTNKEAITAILEPYRVQDNALAFAMIEAGVDGEAKYDGTGREGVYTAAFHCLRSMKVLGGISEGGFSITYKPEALNEKMAQVARSSGKKDLIDEANSLKPVVRGRSPW